MRIAQRICNFAKNFRRFLNGQLTRTRQAAAKIVPADERHRVIQQRAFRTGAEKRNDVRVLKTRSKLNFAPEPVDVDACGELRRQNLYYDLTLELSLCRDEYA